MTAVTQTTSAPTATKARPLVLAEKAVTSTLSRTSSDSLTRKCRLLEIENLADWLKAADRAGDVRGVLITGRSFVDDDVLDRMPSLDVVSVRAVGYDRVSIPACAARGVTVCNTPGVLDGAVADFTMLLILALARRLRDNIQDALERWQSPGFSVALGTDVRGKTLGILGMGRIGSLVAQTAASGTQHIGWLAMAGDTRTQGTLTATPEPTPAPTLATIRGNCRPTVNGNTATTITHQSVT